MYVTSMLVECHSFETSHQGIGKIDSLLNTLAKQKVLFKGKWRNVDRVDFRTFLRVCMRE
jgi:hypothetical protein